MSGDGLSDAELRYRLQKSIVEKLQAEWVELGEPTTTLGGATGRAVVTHPLLTELQAALQKAGILEKALKPRGRGRQIGEVQAPDRTAAAPPKVTKLKAVS